jgi:hypothetical protein
MGVNLDVLTIVTKWQDANNCIEKMQNFSRWHPVPITA